VKGGSAKEVYKGSQPLLKEKNSSNFTHLNEHWKMFRPEREESNVELQQGGKYGSARAFAKEADNAKRRDSY